MIESLKRVFARGTAGFRECRLCGTSVDGLDENCPVCGSEEIASYEL